MRAHRARGHSALDHQIRSARLRPGAISFESRRVAPSQMKRCQIGPAVCSTNPLSLAARSSIVSSGPIAPALVPPRLACCTTITCAARIAWQAPLAHNLRSPVCQIGCRRPSASDATDLSIRARETNQIPPEGPQSAAAGRRGRERCCRPEMSLHRSAAARQGVMAAARAASSILIGAHDSGGREGVALE